MNELIEKLIPLEITIAADKGNFDLFALFSNDEGLEDKWDLVVAATWISEDNKKALDYLSDRLQSFLSSQEFLSISKIAILDVYDPRVKDIQKHYQVEHGKLRLTDYRFYNIRVDIVYLITSKIQVNSTLLRATWPILLKFWKMGNKAISSEEVLEALEEQNFTVPDYALDRIFDYLVTSHCIKGAQHLGRDAIRRHGAIIITFVDRECDVPELSE